MAGKTDHRGWGHLRKLKSGRWQASYIGPDLARHNASTTFEDKDAATSWLRNERVLIEADTWSPPKIRNAKHRADTFEIYANAWLPQRTVRGKPLKPRTLAHYRHLLDDVIFPAFRSVSIKHITPEAVRVWHASLDDGKAKPTPTQNAHAYALLKAILATAVDDDLLPSNPCRVKGAGHARRASSTTTATPAQIERLIDAMPQRFQAMTALAAWCGLRFGETIELRRKDIDVRTATVRVRRAAVLVKGEYLIGTPKSDAGLRDVVIPPHVLPIVKRHLASMPVTGRDALLFPSASDHTKHLRSASLHIVFAGRPADRHGKRGVIGARTKAGLPDSFRWHDLRHTAGSNATAVGAALPDVMTMLGHSTPAAAMRYQHQVQGRAAEIAEALSQLAAR